MNDTEGDSADETKGGGEDQAGNKSTRSRGSKERWIVLN